MSTPTFLDTLRVEVARMQVTHPEREGELARAHALIMLGMVLPSAEDPATGAVLSSDLQQTYSVNGSCSCQAGQHGRDCKHQHAWKLYQYIARKVEERTAPPEPEPLPALGEAPASANVRVTIAGREVQVTLRDTDEARLLQSLQAVLAQYPVPASPAVPQGQPQGQGAGHEAGICPVHQVVMKLNNKHGKTWFSHRLATGDYCKGR